MNKRRLTKLVAIIISTISNPFFVIVVAMVVGNYSLIIAEPVPSFIFFFLVFSLPFIFYFSLLISGAKDWLHFSVINRKERDLIYLGAVFSSLLTTVLFASTGQNVVWVYNAILLCIFFAVFYMLNRYVDKLSLHAGVYAFSMIYLVDKFGVFFAVLLAAIPIICWARIKLHQHTWLQLLLGTVVGMFVGLLSWTY